jgi:hypothetical protein
MFDKKTLSILLPEQTEKPAPVPEQGAGKVKTRRRRQGWLPDSAEIAEQALAALDNTELSRFHLKAILTSGMGFFTEAL